MKLKMPLPNSLFRLGLLFMIFKVFLSLSNIVEMPDYLDTILSVVASGFLVTSILQKQFPMKTLLLFSLIILIGLVTSIRTNNMMMFIAILTCVSVCGEDLDEAIRFILYTEGLLVSMIALISVIMHIMGYSMLIRVSGEMLYGFGFSHPNVFSCILTNLFAMYLWLHFDTVRFRNLLTVALVSIGFFMITDSRTSLAVTLFLVIVMAICRDQEKLHKPLKYLAMYTLPVLAAIFYILCKGFASGNIMAQMIDLGLSGRIRFSAYSLERFGISLFGQNLAGIKVKWDAFWQLSGITFDNIYTYLFVTQCIWLVVIAFLYYRTAKKGDIKHSVFILSWALYGIAEIHVINPFLFFPILVVTSLFDRGEETEENAEEGAD